MLVAHRAAAWADVLSRLLDRALEVDARSHTLGHGPVPADGADVVVLGDDGAIHDVAERVAGIRDTHPACRILVLADAADQSRLRAIQRAGADAVVARDARSAEFVSVVRVLLDGRAVATAERATPTPPHGSGARGASLTTAETRVLFLLAAGRSNEEIAGSLGVTVNTVRTHVQRITGKLGADSRLRAVALARACGALDRVSAAGGLGS